MPVSDLRTGVVQGPIARETEFMSQGGRCRPGVQRKFPLPSSGGAMDEVFGCEGKGRRCRLLRGEGRLEPLHGL